MVRLFSRVLHHAHLPRHGPISSCPVSSTEAVVLEYMALPQGDPARDVLERHFGKNNIAKLVQKYEEEQINKKWIQATTTQCPGCGVRVEKNLGCNHVWNLFIRLSPKADDGYR
jgi:E3 ubiquitin-protein ligase RNF14